MLFVIVDLPDILLSDTNNELLSKFAALLDAELLLMGLYTRQSRDDGISVCSAFIGSVF